MITVIHHPFCESAFPLRVFMYLHASLHLRRECDIGIFYYDVNTNQTTNIFIVP